MSRAIATRGAQLRKLRIEEKVEPKYWTAIEINKTKIENKAIGIFSSVLGNESDGIAEV
jgi:hypothetical protein